MENIKTTQEFSPDLRVLCVCVNVFQNLIGAFMDYLC